MAHVDLQGVGPSASADAARRAAEEQKRVWKNLFGDEDPLGDSLRAGQDALQAKHDAATAAAVEAQETLQSHLRTTADLADSLGNSLSAAFGQGGQAMDQALRILGNYGTAQDQINQQVLNGTLKQDDATKLSRDLQLNSLIGITDAAKSLFKEHSAGYEAMAAAEKALTIIQLARTAVDVAGGAARMFATLGPLAFPAVGAMLAVMASLGFGGGGSPAAPTNNTGTGTVLGSPAAQSESIKNALSALKEVDTTTSVYAREMADSLRSIDSQISGFASQILKAGDINASAGVQTGFKTSTLGNILSAPASILSHIPVIGSVFGAIGGLISSLFGSTTKVTGSGLYGGPQSLASVLDGGFDAQNYSDIEKTKKFFGVTTGHSYSTQYAAADPALQSQFTLILKSFDQAILAAAGPLGDATDAVQSRLDGFIVNIGKIDLSGLTGDQITEKLTAVFGAAADQMAAGAFPDIVRFQQAGEGAFQTLVRVASTVEAVTTSLTELGGATASLGLDAKLGLAAQFDTISDLTSAVDGYFTAFYTKEEQATAKQAQLGRVFDSLGLALPGTLTAYRQLVEAQDLTTAAGQSTYATLLKLAPAFADVQSAMAGAKSAADVLSEQQDLQRQLLELAGDTAAIRALDLAKVDASNRGLQQQVWAVQDAQAAAKAADDLRQAWTSVGDSIMDEVKRIRGLTDGATSGGFAALQGQFNAATLAARAGDQEAAKSLPGLSQALLTAAAASATSRQELDRVQVQTAASLEQTKAAIDAMTGASVLESTTSAAATLAAAATAQAATTPAAANDDTVAEIRALREELAAMRSENNAGHATTAGNTGRTAKVLENVSGASGGDSISTVIAA